jgi:replicative DNA helicase
MSEDSSLHDPAAERAVLGGVFRHGLPAWADVSDLLNPTSFTDPANQAVFHCLRHLLESEPDARPDYPGLYAAASALGHLALLDGPDERRLVRAIANTEVELPTVRRLARRVRRLEIARGLAARLAEAQAALQGVTGDEPVSEILAIAESPILDFSHAISGTASEGPQLLGDGLADYLRHLAEHPVEQIGLKSGWDAYDRVIGGGLRRKSVNVIAARPKTGKTQSGSNIAFNVSLRGAPSLYCDTEMGIEDHRVRLVANVANVEAERIETGQYTRDPEARERVEQAVALLEAIPFRHESVAGRAFEEILAIMRRWLIRHVGFREDGQANDCLIVLDYLKLMDDAPLSKRVAEYQALGFMMTALHNFAVKYGVPILVLLQLNRDGIDGDDTDAVSGSDRIVWLCSSLCYLRWKSEDELAEQVGSDGPRYNLKLIPVATRRGGGLKRGDYINMLGEYRYGRLTCGPTRDELAQRPRSTPGTPRVASDGAVHVEPEVF